MKRLRGTLIGVALLWLVARSLQRWRPVSVEADRSHATSSRASVDSGGDHSGRSRTRASRATQGLAVRSVLFTTLVLGSAVALTHVNEASPSVSPGAILLTVVGGNRPTAPARLLVQYLAPWKTSSTHSYGEIRIAAEFDLAEGQDVQWEIQLTGPLFRSSLDGNDAARLGLTMSRNEAGGEATIHGRAMGPSDPLIPVDPDSVVEISVTSGFGLSMYQPLFASDVHQVIFAFPYVGTVGSTWDDFDWDNPANLEYLTV